MRPIWLGIDWGYRNPAAFVLGCPLDGGERLAIVDVLRQDYRILPELADMVILLNHRGGYGTLAGGWADPSRPDSIREMSGLLGVEILPAPGVSFDEGQKLVNQMFRDGPRGPGLLIHPRCQELIREIPDYTEHEPGDPGHDLCDALRYLVVGWSKKMRWL